MSLEVLQRHYLDQPHEIAIETQTVCNAACSFCPYPTLERVGTKMPDELLYRLVDECSEWTLPFFFTPFKVNEPLLEKRLFPLLKRVNRQQPLARIRIFTNGAALNMRHAEELNDIDNLELWVSVHHIDPTVYRDVLGIDQRHVLANLDALHGTDFRHEVHVLKVGAKGGSEFRQWVEGRWPYFAHEVIKQDSWLGFTNPDSMEVPDVPCARWWELSIMANGVVSHCCMDGEGKYPIGDVTNQTMLDVYNSPFWRERREKQLERKNVPLCAECTY